MQAVVGFTLIPTCTAHPVYTAAGLKGGGGPGFRMPLKEPRSYKPTSEWVSPSVYSSMIEHYFRQGYHANEIVALLGLCHNIVIRSPTFEETIKTFELAQKTKFHQCWSRRKGHSVWTWRKWTESGMIQINVAPIEQCLWTGRDTKHDKTNFEND